MVDEERSVLMQPHLPARLEDTIQLYKVIIVCFKYSINLTPPPIYIVYEERNMFL